MKKLLDTLYILYINVKTLLLLKLFKTTNEAHKRLTNFEKVQPTFCTFLKKISATF